MACETINPKWCENGKEVMAAVQDEKGELIVSGSKGRQFLTEIIEGGHDAEIMSYLYKETARVIMLVRDRLERERPVEGQLEKIIEGEAE